MPKYWISKEGSLKTKKRPMREIKRERERGEFEDPKNRQVTTLSSKARFAELILKGSSWDTQFKRIQIPAFGEPEAVSFVFGKFSTIGEGMKKSSNMLQYLERLSTHWGCNPCLQQSNMACLCVPSPCPSPGVDSPKFSVAGAAAVCFF